MFKRKPFLCGQLCAERDGYLKNQLPLGLYHPKKRLEFRIEKVAEHYGAPVENNSHCQKRSGYLGAHSADIDTNSKPGLKNSIQTHSKVIQQVSAFGPAHVEQARKIYQSNGNQLNHENSICSIPPYRMKMHAGQMLVSQQGEAQIPTSRSHLREDMFEPSKPILKIATISSRPSSEFATKPKNLVDGKNRECAREGLVERKVPQCSKRGSEIDLSCLTILQFLEEISDYGNI